MNIDEVQSLKAAIAVLNKHGYTEAAAALRAVAEQEFAKTAEWLTDL